MREVSSKVGGGDLARFPTEHAWRGMGRSTRADGTRPSVDDRCSRSWANSGGAGAAGDASKHRSLHPAMVKKERELERQYMDELHVLEASDRDTCMAKTGQPQIPTDWIHIDIGDSSRPNDSGADDRSVVGGPRRQRGVDAAGHFQSTPSLTACTSCLCDHQWQGPQVAQRNVWTARCVASFDRKVLDVTNLMGVSLGKFSICVGYRKAQNPLVRSVR